MRFDESKWKVIIFLSFDYVIILKDEILNLWRIKAHFQIFIFILKLQIRTHVIYLNTIINIYYNFFLKKLLKFFFIWKINFLGEKTYNPFLK